MMNVLLLAGLIALDASTAPEGASRAAADPAEVLLARAGELPAGTYVVKGEEIAPADLMIRVVIQADMLKGAERTVRVPIAIGAVMPVASSVRLRVVTSAGSGRVVGEATGSGEPGRVRLVHEFALPPGEYDIYAVVAPRQGADRVDVALGKAHVSVPDVWNGAFAVSPIVVGDAVVQRPGSGERPFTFGETTLSPAASPSFPQSGTLAVGLRVFNWHTDAAAKGDAAKPDLTVEYVFYERTGRGPVFFNKVKPQRLAADTVDKDFNAAGKTATTGMRIPLVSFPFGQFSMKVRVTDHRAKRTSEQQVPFEVVPDTE